MSCQKKFYKVKTRISRVKIEQEFYVPDEIEIIDEICMDEDELEEFYDPLVTLFYNLLEEEGDLNVAEE